MSEHVAEKGRLGEITEELGRLYTLLTHTKEKINELGVNTGSVTEGGTTVWETNAPSKAQTFRMLRERGAVKAVASFSGGNDEGGVEEIALYFEGVEDPVYIDVWGGAPADQELANGVQRPVDEEFGSWAGDFSAHGTLTWDVKAGTVVLDKYIQSGYDHERAEW